MKVDWWLIAPCILLSTIGFTLLKAVSPELANTQLLFIGISTAFFLLFSQTDYLLFFSLFTIEYFLSLIFLLTPYLFGTISRGAVRWIQIGSFSLQPSEVIKPFLVIAFSMIASSQIDKKLILLILSVIPPSAIIFLQPDLGTTLVILVGWSTLLLTQISFKTVLVTLVSLSILAAPVYNFLLHDYQRQRIQTFINPYQDPLGKGYHVIQSIIATGSGGFLGKGLGHGTQSQLRFLPEYHTDFIFATLSESFGFIGSLAVVITYMFLIWRIYQISQMAASKSSSFFCIASAALLSFQIFVNIGMNIGLAPVTGVTLPFLSYGGSSLLSLGITIGIINSISVSRRPELG
jgi:rod shape determining protein RodA